MTGFCGFQPHSLPHHGELYSQPRTKLNSFSPPSLLAGNFIKAIGKRTTCPASLHVHSHGASARSYRSESVDGDCKGNSLSLAFQVNLKPFLLIACCIYNTLEMPGDALASYIQYYYTLVYLKSNKGISFSPHFHV